MSGQTGIRLRWVPSASALEWRKPYRLARRICQIRPYNGSDAVEIGLFPRLRQPPDGLQAAFETLLALA